MQYKPKANSQPEQYKHSAEYLPKEFLIQQLNDCRDLEDIKRFMEAFVRRFL